MTDWLQRPERITAAAAALLLQAALYGVLTAQHPLVSSGAGTAPLMTMIMTATRPGRVAPPPSLPSEPRMRRPAIEPPVVQPIVPSRAERAPASSVDWHAAMQHEVTTELSRAAPRPKVNFGFPQMRAKQQSPLPAFGWDEAHINRVQRIEHGIIDVGPCTITLAFPIPICHFGKGSANGDLFEHMHERPTGEPH